MTALHTHRGCEKELDARTRRAAPTSVEVIEIAGVKTCAGVTPAARAARRNQSWVAGPRLSTGSSGRSPRRSSRSSRLGRAHRSADVVEASPAAHATEVAVITWPDIRARLSWAALPETRPRYLLTLSRPSNTRQRLHWSQSSISVFEVLFDFMTLPCLPMLAALMVGSFKCAPDL
jgi:hypothetical protein